jgi:hypothetical protein
MIRGQGATHGTFSVIKGGEKVKDKLPLHGYLWLMPRAGGSFIFYPDVGGSIKTSEALIVRYTSTADPDFGTVYITTKSGSEYSLNLDKEYREKELRSIVGFRH